MPDQHKVTDKQEKKMLSVAQPPIFTGSWDHRPVVPSPLSSSPIRASSPLSPSGKSAYTPRKTQSSPIQPSKFKYASRPSRPNPLLKKRETAQEARRNGFLQNVRQKSADKAWQRRDIEGQFVKTSWLANLGQLSYDAPSLSEADIEDAMTFDHEIDATPDFDETMLDEIREEPELDAMVSSYESPVQPSQQEQPPSDMSDEDYDSIFAELIMEEPQSHSQSQGLSDEMDITEGDFKSTTS